tara:strand:- start:978 stop:1361 length:384 start_codon:yes stop_codon:yes gene_type:complete
LHTSLFLLLVVHGYSQIPGANLLCDYCTLYSDKRISFLKMVITTKDSILKKYYEANGQMSMFGEDNLDFKTVNLPYSSKYVHLCSEFKLKKVVVAEAEALEVIHLPSLEILKHETKKQLNLNFLTIQ